MASAAKSKRYRSSLPIDPDDISSENDSEVRQILAESPTTSADSAEEEEVLGVSAKNRKRREPPSHVIITEPANVRGDKVPAKNGKRREPPSSATEPANVRDWSPEQVKGWILNLFGDEVAQKFLEEEIDGRALLESKRLEEDSTLDKLGITTIGKKEHFQRELEAIRPDVNVGNSNPFSRKKPRIDTSEFGNYDRLLTREERGYISCKDKGIYNTKKRKITKEVEKRWPRGSVLPNYRNKADAAEVNKFVDKIVEDKTLLFPECGLQKEAVLEIVLKKFREQRRQQKDIPLTQADVLSTDTADSASESSSTSSSPPSSQLARVKQYNLYFHEDMTQSTADVIVMMVLEKLSLKDVKMDQLHKLRKMFNLNLLRGKDKYTHVRAVANSFYSEGYILIPEGANMSSLTRSDIKVVKNVDLGD